MCMAGLEGGPDAARARFRRPARTPRPLASPLPAGRHARRAFDGHERRFRSGDRRRGHDRPRRLGAVRGNRIPNHLIPNPFFHARAGTASRRHDSSRPSPARRPPQRDPRRAGRQLKVCVTQSPEKGKANKALVELLSKSLGLKKSQFELISGETSHQKRFLVRGINRAGFGRMHSAGYTGFVVSLVRSNSIRLSCQFFQCRGERPVGAGVE